MRPFKKAGVILESDRSVLPANDEPGLLEVVFGGGVSDSRAREHMFASRSSRTNQGRE